jgi:FkbM family methyltransferase
VPFYAEYGEDALLSGRFGDSGMFVEVGASDGITISPTLHFEQRGWHGVLIEADPTSAQLCRQNRPNSIVIEAAAVGPKAPTTVTFTVVNELPQLSSIALRHGRDWIREWEQKTGRVATMTEVDVRAATLDELLTEAGIDSVDFITIDVEGHEWSVIQGFSCARWKPDVLIIERMGGRRPDPQIAGRLRASGYVFTRRTGYNDWYEPTRHSGGPLYLLHMGRAWLLPEMVVALRNPRRVLRLRTRWKRLTSRLRSR